MLKKIYVRFNESHIFEIPKNMEIDSLKKIIKNKFNLKYEFNIWFNGIRLTNVSILKSYDKIDIVSKIKGGVLFFAGQLASIVSVIAILVVLLKPILDIIKIVGEMTSILFEFVQIFPPLLEAILIIFDPKRFINDLIFGVSYGIKKVLSGMMDSIDSGTTAQKPPEDESKIPQVCVPPTMVNLFILLICPPLALFLNRGLQGIFLVIVCAILTVKLYYFPGFIFAALHILC